MITGGRVDRNFEPGDLVKYILEKFNDNNSFFVVLNVIPTKTRIALHVWDINNQYTNTIAAEWVMHVD